jgi:RNA polymerase sigma-70 factor (ECF subfamily)
MGFRLGQQFEGVLTAAQAGGEWAIAALYQDLQPAVLRYMRARAGQDGEDLAAETWLSVARNLRSFTGDEAGFRSWVFTIAQRRVADYRRARGRRPAPTPDDALADMAGPDDPAGTALADGGATRPPGGSWRCSRKTRPKSSCCGWSPASPSKKWPGSPDAARARSGSSNTGR